MNHKPYSIFFNFVSTHLTHLENFKTSSHDILVHKITNHFSGDYFKLCNIILDFIHDESALSVIKSILVFAITQRQHPF